MAVPDVAAEVVAVLARARTLFLHPDAVDVGAAHVGAAAEASAAIAGRTAELSGTFAVAHRAALEAASTALEHASGADAQLADHLGAAADIAHVGATSAEDLHGGADGVMDALDPWSDLPVAELGALRALRQHVAGMQQLMAEHADAAQQSADAMAALLYGQ